MRRLCPKPIPVGCGGSGNSVVLAGDAMTKAVEDDEHGGFLSGVVLIHSRGHWVLSTKPLLYRDPALDWGLFASAIGASATAALLAVRRFAGIGLR